MNRFDSIKYFVNSGQDEGRFVVGQYWGGETLI